MMNLILGTITFGQQTWDEDAAVMVHTALKHNVREIDTAYVYNEGESENILGRILNSCDPDSYRLATKVNPRITGRLDREAILSQFTESLERLGLPSVDVLYLHFPDRNVPLTESLGTCDELYRQGKIREIGLSNFPAWMVEEACMLCQSEGWLMPSVYEGVYNVLSRNAEGELFDTLRRYGLRYTAYNPLAGGLLTGKYSSVENIPTDGRFAKRASYKQRYWRKSFFDAASVLKKACEKAGISMTSAALRWLAYHSSMKEELGDGIIIGASNPSQLIQNIEALKEGPLPEETVRIFNEAWLVCKEDAPPYYKFLS